MNVSIDREASKVMGQVIDTIAGIFKWMDHNLCEEFD